MELVVDLVSDGEASVLEMALREIRVRIDVGAW